MSTAKEIIEITPDTDYQYLVYKPLQAIEKEQAVYVCSKLDPFNTARINTSKEVNRMYYIYCIIDPRNNEPFYVGKGSNKRYLDHLKYDKNNRRKTNKINKIISDGFIPIITFLMTDIEDESVAYEYERYFIKYIFGRKDYESYGMLLNHAEGGNSPPSHKGKTYAEIYGSQLGEQQRISRATSQLIRGGYGPKKHSEETKRKISNSLKTSASHIAHNTRPRSEEFRQKISQANLGKKRQNTITFKFISPDNEEYITVNKKERDDLYQKFNLSHSTFESAEKYNWCSIKSGRNKGWKRIRISS